MKNSPNNINAKLKNYLNENDEYKYINNLLKKEENEIKNKEGIQKEENNEKDENEEEEDYEKENEEEN